MFQPKQSMVNAPSLPLRVRSHCHKRMLSIIVAVIVNYFGASKKNPAIAQKANGRVRLLRCPYVKTRVLLVPRLHSLNSAALERFGPFDRAVILSVVSSAPPLEKYLVSAIVDCQYATSAAVLKIRIAPSAGRKCSASACRYGVHLPISAPRQVNAGERI